MSILSAMILGLIQGVAEFLPISSSGHLSIFQNFFGLRTADDGHLLFDALLHLATLVSVCIFYRKDIAEIVTESVSFVKSVGHPQPGGKKTFPKVRLLLMMFIATLPLVAILPIKDHVEQLYYNTTFIGIVLLVTGVVLFFSDRLAVGNRSEKTMTVKNAIIIGICQAIAIIPGLSRSGSTITAGLFGGLNREFAVKFSFLISIPAILGANLLSLADVVSVGFDTALLPAYLIGMAIAMVTGYLSLGFLRAICNKGKFGRFAYYCWAAGILTIILTIVL